MFLTKKHGGYKIMDRPLTHKVITKDDLLKLYKKQTEGVLDEEPKKKSSPEEFIKECQSNIDSFKEKIKNFAKLKVQDIKTKLPKIISELEKLVEEIDVINDSKSGIRASKSLNILKKVQDKFTNKEFGTMSEVRDYLSNAVSVFDTIKLNEDSLEYLNKSEDDIKNLKEITLNEGKKEPVFIIEAPMIFALDRALSGSVTKKLESTLGLSKLAGYNYIPKAQFIVGNTKILLKNRDINIQLKAVLKVLNKKLPRKMILIEDIALKRRPFQLYWIVPQKIDQSIETLLDATVDYSIFIK